MLHRKTRKKSLKNKSFEKVGNWISQLPTKLLIEDKRKEVKPIKYLLK